MAANGRAGVNWEHAWGDGVAVLYYFNEVFAASGAMPARAPSAPTRAEPARLQWHLDDGAALAAIRTAESSFDATIGATQLRVYRSEALKKADIKASRLSPDGVMQMALQLAYARAHRRLRSGGSAPSTYESASTAGFKYGRTETIRVATAESVAFCAAFNRGDGAPDDAELVNRYIALSAAASRHSERAREAATGRGVDRHLFALRTWCARLARGAPPPAIFSNAAHSIFNDIGLSTSTLESPALEGGGFGPVNRTSYGVGYGVEERGAHFHVMNYAGGDCDAATFTAGLETALRDISAAIDAARRAGALGKK